MVSDQEIDGSRQLCSVHHDHVDNSLACHYLAPASATDWFMKGRVMCYHVYVIMHVKDPELSVVRVGHCVPLAGFGLSLYSPHVLNRDINMTKKTSKCAICIILAPFRTGVRLGLKQEGACRYSNDTIVAFFTTVFFST